MPWYEIYSSVLIGAAAIYLGIIGAIMISIIVWLSLGMLVNLVKIILRIRR
jgi:hypothetical protein